MDDHLKCNNCRFEGCRGSFIQIGSALQCPNCNVVVDDQPQTEALTLEDILGAYH